MAFPPGFTPIEDEEPPPGFAFLPDEPPAAPKPPDWSERLGLKEPTSSRALGFARGAGTAAVDMAEGAVSGAASTVFHGGDLVRRALGMGRIVNDPKTQQAMHAPENIQGSIGRFAEQGAEFAVPLTKIAKATRGMSTLGRLGIESAASAGVAGAQTGGDSMAMGTAAVAPGALRLAGTAGGAIARRASAIASGAQDGGLGGALAATVRTAVPSTSKQMMIQAVKPRNTRLGFDKSLDLSLAEIKATERAIGKPITTLEELVPAIKASKVRVRAQYDAMAGPHRALGSTVDLSPVADAMEASIPKKVQLQSPELADGVRTMAKPYRDRFPIEDAEQLLQETNAELQAYYNKFPAAKRASELADPEVAHLVAQGKALRAAIYKTLDDPGQGEAAREVQRRYGALMELEDATLRRSNVAARQAPESLSEQIGKVRAAAAVGKGVWRLAHGDWTGAADLAGAHAGRATATYLKEQQTTDALIRRALAAHKGFPSAIAMPPPPTGPTGAPRSAGPRATPPAGASVPPAVTTTAMGRPGRPPYTQQPNMSVSVVPPTGLQPKPQGALGMGRTRGELPPMPPGQLPAYRKPIIPPPPRDPSGVRGVPAAPLSADDVLPSGEIRAFSGDVGAPQVPPKVAPYRNLGTDMEPLFNVDGSDVSAAEAIKRGFTPGPVTAGADKASATAMRDAATARRTARDAMTPEERTYADYEAGRAAEMAPEPVATPEPTKQRPPAPTPATVTDTHYGEQLGKYKEGGRSATDAEILARGKGDIPNETPAAPAGPLAPRGAPERVPPDVGGPVPAGSRPAGPQERWTRTTAEQDAGAIDDLVGEATSGGYAGDPATLKTVLRERLQAIKDIDAEFGDSGHNPQALLKAISDRGGLSVGKESALKGELHWLKEHQDTKASSSRTNLKAPDVKVSGQVKGVKGVFHESGGMSVDDMLTSLHQESRFQHIETLDDLLEEVRAAATHMPNESAAARLKAGHGEKWWEGVGDATETAGGDLDFAFGEADVPLPGFEAVRQTENATPTFEAPFSLNREPAARTGKQNALRFEGKK